MKSRNVPNRLPADRNETRVLSECDWALGPQQQQREDFIRINCEWNVHVILEATHETVVEALQVNWFDRLARREHFISHSDMHKRRSVFYTSVLYTSQTWENNEFVSNPPLTCRVEPIWHESLLFIVLLWKVSLEMSQRFWGSVMSPLVSSGSTLWFMICNTVLITANVSIMMLAFSSNNSLLACLCWSLVTMIRSAADAASSFIHLIWFWFYTEVCFRFLRSSWGWGCW